MTDANIDLGPMEAEPEFVETTPQPSHKGKTAKSKVRDPIRDPIREAPRLHRVRRDHVDPFHVPKEIIPDGWTYQWNAISVVGNADVVLDKTMGYYENHWRPVPAERHPGLFVPYGTKGEIVRGGCRLEERPKYLTDEAKVEQVNAAKQQLRIQTESVMGHAAASLPAGFEAPNAYQRQRFGAQKAMVQIDRSLDIPPPSGNYQIAGSDD